MFRKFSAGFLVFIFLIYGIQGGAMGRRPSAPPPKTEPAPTPPGQDKKKFEEVDPKFTRSSAAKLTEVDLSTIRDIAAGEPQEASATHDFLVLRPLTAPPENPVEGTIYLSEQFESLYIWTCYNLAGFEDCTWRWMYVYPVSNIVWSNYDQYLAPTGIYPNLSITADGSDALGTVDGLTGSLIKISSDAEYTRLYLVHGSDDPYSAEFNWQTNRKPIQVYIATGSFSARFEAADNGRYNFIFNKGRYFIDLSPGLYGIIGEAYSLGSEKTIVQAPVIFSVGR